MRESAAKDAGRGRCTSCVYTSLGLVHLKMVVELGESGGMLGAVSLTDIKRPMVVRVQNGLRSKVLYE